MASILQVEQIQGPTSGANANTITIPSGQTLDISNSTLLGNIGKVLKVTTGTRNGTQQLSTSGTSAFADFTTFGELVLTPENSNALIYFTIVGTNGGSTLTDWTQIRLLRKIGSGSYTEIALHSDRTSDNSYYSSFTFCDLFQNTGTDTITYKFQGRTIGGGNPQGVHLCKSEGPNCTYTLMEIAA